VTGAKTGCSAMRVLCIGDSLTSGVTGPCPETCWCQGNSEHKYGDSLSKRTNVHMRVTSDGFEGALARDMPARLDGLFVEAIARSEMGERGRYDAVIILGGTYDLLAGATAEEILAPLLLCVESARQHGAIVILNTVPEMKVELRSVSVACGGLKAGAPYHLRGSDMDGLATGIQIRRERSKLNKMILEEIPKRNKLLNGTKVQGDDMCKVVDLAAYLYMSGLPEDLRADLWADDIHLTPKGYRVMGSIIAPVLDELMAFFRSKTRPKSPPVRPVMVVPGSPGFASFAPLPWKCLSNDSVDQLRQSTYARTSSPIDWRRQPMADRSFRTLVSPIRKKNAMSMTDLLKSVQSQTPGASKTTGAYKTPAAKRIAGFAMQGNPPGRGDRW